MNVLKAKKIHIVGISGIGLSGLAKILLLMKKTVTGSDLVKSLVTDDLKKLGADIFIGQHKSRNVPKDFDLMIYSKAVPLDNIELKKAKKLGKTILSYPEALSQLTVDKKLICVSGMHGKTTTTAMIASILKKAGVDPTFIVGSFLPEISGNAYFGKSNYFVIEADEYERSMLNYYPDFIVLTNIEKDHLDTYKDLDDIKDTFKRYVKNLTKSGTLICNADDKIIREVAKVCEGSVITFGLKKGDIKASKIIKREKGYSFIIGDAKISLRIPGSFNIYNALAAFVLAMGLNLKIEDIKKALENYKGTWRRFELIGKFRNCPVISDYAHHPTEIKAILTAARESYPEKRIVILYQPHQHNRVRHLFREFIPAFDLADLIIMNEIFDVSGREEKEDQDVSSIDLVKEIKKRKKEVYFVKSLKSSLTLLKKKVKNNDLILIVGAGDVYKIGEELVK